jgi:hypothetical protein
VEVLREAKRTSKAVTDVVSMVDTRDAMAFVLVSTAAIAAVVAVDAPWRCVIFPDISVKLLVCVAPSWRSVEMSAISAKSMALTELIAAPMEEM